MAEVHFFRLIFLLLPSVSTSLWEFFVILFYHALRGAGLGYGSSASRPYMGAFENLPSSCLGTIEVNWGSIVDFVAVSQVLVHLRWSSKFNRGVFKLSSSYWGASGRCPRSSSWFLRVGTVSNICSPWHGGATAKHVAGASREQVPAQRVANPCLLRTFNL